MNRWFKLDNAAKVFPSVSNKRRPNVFRLAFELTEDIEPTILQEALNLTIDRFKSLKVKLKKGVFWFYLDANNEKMNIFEENPIICKRINRKENNGYLFRVLYFKNRITVEIFHSLTDGTGGLELLKAICYNYLVLKGYELESENIILTDVESTYEEFQDSYLKNYDNRIKSAPRDVKAMKLKGTLYEDSWLSLIVGNTNLEQTKRVSKNFNATITEFLCACLIKTAMRTTYMFDSTKRPFQMLVPVNLRKVFPSKTLRNFSLVISSGCKIENELSFEDIIKIVKEDFVYGLRKEYLHAQIVANVVLEKNIFMRITPLFLKDFALKIGYKAWGDSINSLTISNLGKVELPKSMDPFVEKIVFSNGASNTIPINCGVVSHGNNLVISFTSAIIERDFQREFFRLLTNFGIDVVIESNELEV